MIKSMSKNPIVFVCANPDPEIKPEHIKESEDYAEKIHTNGVP